MCYFTSPSVLFYIVMCKLNGSLIRTCWEIQFVHIWMYFVPFLSYSFFFRWGSHFFFVLNNSTGHSKWQLQKVFHKTKISTAKEGGTPETCQTWWWLADKNYEFWYDWYFSACKSIQNQGPLSGLEHWFGEKRKIFPDNQNMGPFVTPACC